jgi:hypothetical protein
LPQFAPMQTLPGSTGVLHRIVQTYFAGRGEFAARLSGASKQKRRGAFNDPDGARN